jgi:hypothetical protein
MLMGLLGATVGLPMRCGGHDNLLALAQHDGATIRQRRWMKPCEQSISRAISPGIVAQPVKSHFLVQIALATGRGAPNVDVMGPARPLRCPASLGWMRVDLDSHSELKSNLNPLPGP